MAARPQPLHCVVAFAPGFAALDRLSDSPSNSSSAPLTSSTTASSSSSSPPPSSSSSLSQRKQRHMQESYSPDALIVREFPLDPRLSAAQVIAHLRQTLGGEADFQQMQTQRATPSHPRRASEDRGTDLVAGSRSRRRRLETTGSSQLAAGLEAAAANADKAWALFIPSLNGLGFWCPATKTIGSCFPSLAGHSASNVSGGGSATSASSSSAISQSGAGGRSLYRIEVRHAPMSLNFVVAPVTASAAAVPEGSGGSSRARSTATTSIAAGDSTLGGVAAGIELRADRWSVAHIEDRTVAVLLDPTAPLREAIPRLKSVLHLASNEQYVVELLASTACDAGDVATQWISLNLAPGFLGLLPHSTLLLRPLVASYMHGPSLATEMPPAQRVREIEFWKRLAARGIEYCGWLTKASFKGAKWTNPTRRWFVLHHNGVLCYYKTPTSAHPAGEQPISLECYVVTRSQTDPRRIEMYCALDGFARGNDAFAFRTADEVEADAWFKKLRRKCFNGLNNRTFGTPLALLVHGRDAIFGIPSLLVVLCETLLQFGRESEGLFRVSGQAKVIDRVRERVDQGDFALLCAEDVMVATGGDVHCVTGLLKLFLRELPEPLIPVTLQTTFIRIGTAADGQSSSDQDKTDFVVGDLTALVNSNLMPSDNKKALAYLFLFVHELVSSPKTVRLTRMDASNYAVVLAPNLVRAASFSPVVAAVEGGIVAPNHTDQLQDQQSAVAALEALIMRAKEVFSVFADEFRRLQTSRKAQIAQLQQRRLSSMHSLTAHPLPIGATSAIPASEKVVTLSPGAPPKATRSARSRRGKASRALERARSRVTLRDDRGRRESGVSLPDASDNSRDSGISLPRTPDMPLTQLIVDFTSSADDSLSSESASEGTEEPEQFADDKTSNFHVVHPALPTISRPFITTLSAHRVERPVIRPKSDSVMSVGLGAYRAIAKAHDTPFNARLSSSDTPTSNGVSVEARATNHEPAEARLSGTESRSKTDAKSNLHGTAEPDTNEPTASGDETQSNRNETSEVMNAGSQRVSNNLLVLPDESLPQPVQKGRFSLDSKFISGPQQVDPEMVIRQASLNFTVQKHPRCPPLRKGLVCALQTPFQQLNNGQTIVDKPSLQRLVIDAAKTVDGFVYPTVTSEVAMLAEAERRDAASLVAHLALSFDIPWIGGAVASDDDPAQLRSDILFMHELGASAILLAVPARFYASGLATSDQGLGNYVAALCDSVISADFPILIQDYDPSGPGLSIDALVSVRDQLGPSILVGVKVETLLPGPKCSAIRERCGSSFFVAVTCVPPLTLEALDRGVDAIISDASMARVYRAIVLAHASGQRDDARSLFRRLTPMLTFAHQDVATSIAFFKRLQVKKGTFAVAAQRHMGLFRWDEFNERIADELIDEYLSLEEDICHSNLSAIAPFTLSKTLSDPSDPDP